MAAADSQRPPAPAVLGFFGLGVMGRNLALNAAEHGFPTLAHDRDPDVVRSFAAAVPPAMPLRGEVDLEAFVGGLRRPRCVWIMVKAGDPVDWTIRQILPHLEPGDVLIDGGNSHPDDTARRDAELASARLHFLGIGVSGGEDGARHGPSLMAGGPAPAYAAVREVLEAIAARSDDGPCAEHVGTGNAGHLVKTVHNGIEYGEMQAIAEAYDLLTIGQGLDPRAIAELFEDWNDGPLRSFLFEITARILRQDDPDTGRAMVDVIVDSAGQKGTGRWACELGLEHGVPLPTIQAAVLARGLSVMRPLRQRIAPLLPAATALGRVPAPDVFGEALLASRIATFAQGFDLLQRIDAAADLGIRLERVSRVWKAGCIIRARLLDDLRDAYDRDPDLEHLLLDPRISARLATGLPALRAIIAHAAARGVPALALAGSLGYFESLRRERLPQSLTQAQRDLFGAHRFERVDRPAGETFHHEWQ